MTMRVDYNSIAPFYNSRYSENQLEGISNFLISEINKNSPNNILEVGCGTAHWLKEISLCGSKLFGVDYSYSMLKIAQSATPKTSFVNGNANLLPFKEKSFDLIIVINAIHHFPNWPSFILDAFNLLTNNGEIIICGLEPRDSQHSWYLYKYFKDTYKTDLNRYPTFLSIKDTMKQIGYSLIEINLLQKVESSISGRDVLVDHFLDKKGASQLALLSDQEYKAGIEKIKEDIENAEKSNSRINFKTELFFYSISGRKK